MPPDTEPARAAGSVGVPTGSVDVPTGNVEVIPGASMATAPLAPPVVAPPGSVPPPAPHEDAASTGVRLGFTDGSDVALDPDHPHSLALRAVADVLLHRGGRGPR